jgi:hypothetical protein
MKTSRSRGVASKIFGHLEAPGSNPLANYQIGYYAVVPDDRRWLAHSGWPGCASGGGSMVWLAHFRP